MSHEIGVDFNPFALIAWRWWGTTFVNKIRIIVKEVEGLTNDDVGDLAKALEKEAGG